MMNQNSVAKRLLVLLLVCALCGTFIFAMCASASQEQTDEATGSEVALDDIEELIIGKWILTDLDGQPALTDEKAVYTFASPTNGYVSLSLITHPEVGEPWIQLLEADISSDDNKSIFTYQLDDQTMAEEEFIITDINSDEFSAERKVAITTDSSELPAKEALVRFIKIDDDFSEDILGTWEGRCTSEGSAFDDGQDHRWEYKADGTYSYYVKDGDAWVLDKDTLNEYFVDGNLLCTRWINSDEEYREWWEIDIDGDVMNWTALREDEDGNTFTASFEMTRVEE